MTGKTRNPAAHKWSAFVLAELVKQTWPPPATTIEGAPAFATWWDGWQADPAGKAALRQFDKVRPVQSFEQEEWANEAMRALSRLARAGYLAAFYVRESDPGEAHREAIRAGRLRTEDTANLADELARVFRRNYPGFEHALAAAQQEAGVGNRRPASRLVRDVWPEFFEALAKRLREPLPDLHGGPFLYHFTVGNLHFERRRKTGRPLDTATLLLFEVVFEIRLWGTRWQADSFQQPQPMPAAKMPAGGYELAAAWARAALDAQCTAAQVRERLRTLPAGTGLMGWPHEAKR